MNQGMGNYVSNVLDSVVSPVGKMTNHPALQPGQIWRDPDNRWNPGCDDLEFINLITSSDSPRVWEVLEFMILGQEECYFHGGHPRTFQESEMNSFQYIASVRDLITGTDVAEKVAAMLKNG